MPSLLLALVFGQALPGRLQAGPPYETDDPEPPAPGHWELIFAGYAAAQDGSALGGAPQLEFNYGASENLQLSLSPQMAFASSGGSGAYGLGDTTAGAKYRFLGEGGAQPQAAFYPQVVLPTGDAQKELGNGRAQLFLPLWLQKSWGPWTSFGGGGTWINPGTGNKNWTFVGAALQRDLGERFSVGGEIFFHSAAQVGDVNGLGSNLAFLYHLSPDDHLLFSAGRDLVGRTTFTGYAAYQKMI